MGISFWWPPFFSYYKSNLLVEFLSVVLLHPLTKTLSSKTQLMGKKPSIPTSDSSSMGEQRLLGRETERLGVWVSEDLLFMIIFSVMLDFFSMSIPYLFLQTPNNKESSKPTSWIPSKVFCTRHLSRMPTALTRTPDKRVQLSRAGLGLKRL